MLLRAGIVASIACCVLGCGSDGLDQSSRTGDGVTTGSQSVPITVGSWKPGDDAFTAGLNGTLARSKAGCIYVAAPKGVRTLEPGLYNGVNVVWPAGYSADESPGGDVNLRDPEGLVVAHLGTPISTGGGAPPHPFAVPSNAPCAVRGLAFFVVMAELPPLSSSE